MEKNIKQLLKMGDVLFTYLPMKIQVSILILLGSFTTFDLKKRGAVWALRSLNESVIMLSFEV